MNNEKFELLKNKILSVLKQYPESRNSDKYLTWLVWHKETIRNFAEYEQLENEESISRVRRRIQNYDKMYLPTDWEVAKRRRILEQEWKISMGYSVNDVNQQEMFGKAVCNG